MTFSDNDKTTYPQAGAGPIIVILGGYNWSYLVSPIVIGGSIIIVFYALVINNLRTSRKDPLFWK
ncbi:HPP family protein [Domibacillus aminovorans]|uniref:HPP family protein n=1 Tax=Domibacillus aminovorans TaxID=29332 RepID=UPI0009EDE815